MKRALMFVGAFALVVLALTLAAGFALGGLYSAIEDMGAALLAEIQSLREAVEAGGIAPGD